MVIFRTDTEYENRREKEQIKYNTIIRKIKDDSKIKECRVSRKWFIKKYPKFACEVSVSDYVLCLLFTPESAIKPSFILFPKDPYTHNIVSENLPKYLLDELKNYLRKLSIKITPIYYESDSSDEEYVDEEESTCSTSTGEKDDNDYTEYLFNHI